MAGALGPKMAAALGSKMAGGAQQRPIFERFLPQTAQMERRVATTPGAAIRRLPPRRESAPRTPSTADNPSSSLLV